MLSLNLIKMYESSFRDNHNLMALSDYFKKEEQFTYFEVAQEIAKLHLLFEECGIRHGDKIALIGRNNTRWCVSYMATITYGAVIVPILQDFSSNDVHNILRHSEAKLLFCGDMYWDTIHTDQIPGVMAAFSLTGFDCLYERRGDLISRFQRSIARHFDRRYKNGFSLEDIKYREVANDDVVLLNYTSGTTGFSKGVMLTCNNLTGNVAFCMDFDLRKRGSRVLSFLPLAHAYGCMVDLLLSFAVGAHLTLLGKIPAPKVLIEAMQEVKPPVICCVPLIIEKICRKHIFPMLKRKSMSVAMKIPMVETVVFSKARRALIDLFGGKVEQFIIGGAPLNSEVEEFLAQIKFPFSIGYGMTECGPLISYSPLEEYRLSSCGKALKGYMEVRIDSPDPITIPGEILTRGENVMKGYYKNQSATDEVLDAGGWLHTGDIGTMDADGMIYIRGRSKSMILGANGQNIYPEEIEAKLNNMPCVMESLVVEREGKLVALVCPDYEQIGAHDISKSKLDDVMKNNLAELNKQVAPYERVSEIVLYPGEFEKTPKKSIKRYLYNV